MKTIINLVKGIAIGIATLVPGVSGGTMAIILGIYDDLIHSISAFFKDWKKNTWFLAQIGIGALLAIALFSKLLENALITYPYVMKFFFIGVIFGGLPMLYKKATEDKANGRMSDIIFMVLGFISVVAMSFEPEQMVNLATGGGVTTSIFLIIAGFIIAIALILPGISGSFMLLILGLYEITLNSIYTFNLPFLIPLAIGGLLGTIATTKAIESLLQKHPSKTYMLILGFVAGSLVQIFPGIPNEILTLLLSFVCMAVGFILIYWMGKKDNR